MTTDQKDFFNQPEIADFHQFESDLYQKHQIEAEEKIIRRLTELFSNLSFLDFLRHHASRRAYKYQGLRTVQLRLASGNTYPIKSPMFIKAKPKSGRKRKRRQDVCHHLGLTFLGFNYQCSPVLAERAVAMAALCPSFDTACQALRLSGTTLTHNLLRRITYNAAESMMKNRAEIVVDDHYRQKNIRLLICIDGGRYRERVNKKGRKKKNARIHDFYTNWREPRLITLCLVDEKGQKIKGIDPIYDGTIASPELVSKLICSYLLQINVKDAAAITFCADGAPWIWTQVDEIIKEMDLKNVQRVLDYTHAKQNLKEIVDKVHQACGIWDYEYESVQGLFKAWLWKGDIDAMESYVLERLKGKRQKKSVLKKLREYFGDHRKFQYQNFKANGIPTGSGMVESAIRRIINMRVKGCGLFWLKENAEKIIFIRSQVLSNRWTHCMKKRLDIWRNQFSRNEKDCMSAVA